MTGLKKLVNQGRKTYYRPLLMSWLYQDDTVCSQVKVLSSVQTDMFGAA